MDSVAHPPSMSMATPQWRITLRSDVDVCRQLDLPAAVEISLIFGNQCTHLFACESSR